MWFFFSSKNQKLVKRFIKEHEQIVTLAGKVIAAYSNNQHIQAKIELKKLSKVAVTHIMHEDIEFYRILGDTKRVNNDTEALINEFTETFHDTKSALIDFLNKYTKDEVVLDDRFFKIFNDIVAILGKRIEFEEKNLYKQLKES